MFFNTQDLENKEEYENLLKSCGYLSNLFSESTTPYLYYRLAEKVFCRAFNADDLSRSDVAVDAKIGNTGFGIKTFLANNNKSYQKVAEFNKTRTNYKDLKPRALIVKISELRNERISFAQRLYGLDNMLYHCILRKESKFSIFEEKMHLIDVKSIRDIKISDKSISFYDGINEYSFSLSKSTLLKRFSTKDIIHEFDVKVLEDPFLILSDLLQQDNLDFQDTTRIKQTIYLPLYGENNFVYEKSGLNQWNANGRKRDVNEVYIPIPAKIHHNFPSFFPPRDKPFSLFLPNGKILSTKICQDGGKALMSHSNKELGQWILRDVLKLDEGELLTYDKLQEIGIDSVRIDKIGLDKFEINFSKIGSYDEFNQLLV